MSEMTNNSFDGKVLTLKDLWSILIQRLWIIGLAAVVSVAVTFVFVKAMVPTMYSSTATLYILRQEDDGASSTDFSLALNVVNDCDYLLKSHAVLDEVMGNVGLDMDYETLYNSISTSNPDDTRILEVTVMAESPEMAKMIVDELCVVGPEQIASAMGFQQVNLYEYGRLETKPANSIGIGEYLLVAIIAGVLTYAVFLFIFLVDDRLHSAEEIERQLGLSVLGEIPNANETRKYGRYGYGMVNRKGTRKEEA